jgi:hypothetical protein
MTTLLPSIGEQVSKNGGVVHLFSQNARPISKLSKKKVKNKK